MRGVPFAVGAAILGAVCLASLTPGTVVYAHHSIAGIYDDSHPVTVEGVVTRFRFVDPHPFLVMEVKDGHGKPQRWTMEMDNRWELAELGFRTETLKPGDRLVVLGSLARRQPHSLYIRKLDRPADGFTYQHHP
ncbi:MAG TPA: DUF6152 family protein [Vicinamibacterales bacterium]|jgi:hypothetical protein|nr:DUF6152 family protein [Vicinamibacterales bacterium]